MYTFKENPCYFGINVFRGVVDLKALCIIDGLFWFQFGLFFMASRQTK